MLIKSPKYNLIEKVAGELAGTFYEIGRSQGLTSQCKNARAFAKKNLEKFIPKAIEYLLAQLNDPAISLLIKEEIYEALIERHNDPTLNYLIPPAKGLH